MRMSHVDDGTLHAYLDGELSPVERARVDAHVADCPPCRERLAEERSLIERADALLALATPEERPAPPLHQLRAPRPRWRFQLPLAWAATITLAFIAGWQLRPASPLREVAPRVLATAPTLRANTPTDRPDEQRQARSPAADRLGQRAAPPAPAVNADAAAAIASPSPVAVATPGLAAGAGARPELHGQPAAPIPQNAVVVTTPSRLDLARRASARTTAIGTTWPVIEAEPARRLLRSQLALIPGFPIRDIRQSPGTDSTIVVVEQELDAETLVQIYQTRMAEAGGQMSGYAQGTTIADPSVRTVGSLRVRIAGPLSADSLLKLLSLVK